MCKLHNADLDKIEKQTVEEMVSEEQNLQVKLKKVLVIMETKRTDFDNIRQDVNKVKKYATADVHRSERNYQCCGRRG